MGFDEAITTYGPVVGLVVFFAWQYFTTSKPTVSGPPDKPLTKAEFDAGMDKMHETLADLQKVMYTLDGKVSGMKR